MENFKLRSSMFDVQINSQTGVISTIRCPADRYQTNFVLTPQQVPSFDVEDSRFVGDFIIHARDTQHPEGLTMTSSLSSDIRKVRCSTEGIQVVYSGVARHSGGIRDLSITQSYSLCGPSQEVFDWSMEIANETSNDLDIEDFGVPLPMSSYWGFDQTHNYEQSVHRHSFVAGHGSYIYWQRPNGDGNILVMTPHENTALEFKQRYRENEGPYGERLPNWEGLAEYYIHAKNISKLSSNKARMYLQATSLLLRPGQSQKYGFSFRWATGYEGLRQAVYDAGSVDIISMPGMVLPLDYSALLAVHCLHKIHSVTGDSDRNVNISFVKQHNGYHIYQLQLGTLGETHITVTYGDSRTTVLQYYCIERLEKIIKDHAAFLAKNQLARTQRGYNGAFLQWNMSSQKLLTWDDYPGGGWKEWMVGGSDDLGLAPSTFLSEKCVHFPEQSEVSALDYHIDNFLFGYLMNARDANGLRTFQVYRWFDGQDGVPQDTGIWRAYNYTHIANTLFNMYRIAKNFPQIATRRTSLEYLVCAFEVLNAMYSKIDLPNPIGDAANTLGLMGESNIIHIIEALRTEGLDMQATVLRNFIKRKVAYYKSVKYPFASEQSIDTTGFESVYTMCRLEEASELVHRTQKASLACRGIQPLWYFYGSDNRMMGESYWNLGYETQLGAWQQQEYLLDYSSENELGFADSMRSTYGAYLAGWANINSGQIDDHPANLGAAAWLWQSEGGEATWDWMQLCGCWWAWSGEADLGFWGGLKTASVNVVNDPVVGLFAYGGTASLENHAYNIIPADGLRCRFAIYCLGNLSVCIENARYTEASVADDASQIRLKLEDTSSPAHVVRITVSNLPQGLYHLTVSGSPFRTDSMVTGDTRAIFDLTDLPRDPQITIIQSSSAEQV